MAEPNNKSYNALWAVLGLIRCRSLMRLLLVRKAPWCLTRLTLAAKMFDKPAGLLWPCQAVRDFPTSIGWNMAPQDNWDWRRDVLCRICINDSFLWLCRDCSTSEKFWQWDVGAAKISQLWDARFIWSDVISWEAWTLLNFYQVLAYAEDLSNTIPLADWFYSLA